MKEWAKRILDTFRKASLKTGSWAEVITHDLLSGLDIVAESNREALGSLLKKNGIKWEESMSCDFGILASQDLSQDQERVIYEAFDRLEDYPLLDEEDYEDREFSYASKAWEDWGEGVFLETPIEHLEKHLPLFHVKFGGDTFRLYMENSSFPYEIYSDGKVYFPDTRDIWAGTDILCMFLLLKGRLEPFHDPRKAKDVEDIMFRAFVLNAFRNRIVYHAGDREIVWIMPDEPFSWEGVGIQTPDHLLRWEGLVFYECRMKPEKIIVSLDGVESKGETDG